MAFSGDTRLFCVDGAPKAKDVCGKAVRVWHNGEWRDMVVLKKDEYGKLYRITLSDGSEHHVDKDFRWKVYHHKKRDWVRMRTSSIVGEIDHVFPCTAETGVYEKDAIYMGAWAFAVKEKMGRKSKTQITWKLKNDPSAGLQQPGFISNDMVVDELIECCVPDYMKCVVDFGRFLPKHFVDHFVRGNPGLPDEVFMWNKDSITAFLTGMRLKMQNKFLGHKRNNFLVFLMHKNKANLLQDVQILLKRIGCNDSILSRGKNILFSRFFLDGTVPECQRVFCQRDHNIFPESYKKPSFFCISGNIPKDGVSLTEDAEEELFANLVSAINKDNRNPVYSRDGPCFIVTVEEMSLDRLFRFFNRNYCFEFNVIHRKDGTVSLEIFGPSILTHINCRHDLIRKIDAAVVMVHDTRMPFLHETYKLMPIVSE